VGRRTKDSGFDGLFVIDKPAGITSTDVVSRVRRLTGQRRCGHSGTLDPGATGVLLVALGNCTRLLQYLHTHTKSYTCEMVLGVATHTLDDEGQVTATADMSGVSAQEVQSAAAALVGDSMQVPPMVSAVQVDGKRLHEYAREGIEIERAARPIHVTRYDVTPTEDPLVYRVSVDCSTGTYVRVLVADVGQALGGHAHLRKLRRTAIGPFTELVAVPLDDELPSRTPLTPQQMLGHLPQASVSPEVMQKVALGSVLDRTVFGDASSHQLWQVIGNDRLLALYEPFRDGLAKPALVLADRSTLD
jgi:tRNA pseudouridine55 synthase